MTEQKLTWTAEEAMRASGIGRNSFYRLIHQPGFPVLRIGRKVLIPIDAFRAWLNQRSDTQGRR